MTLLANATPTKRFFILNLTRDLSLEDAILDLVDNSIDAFIRIRDIDVSSAILKAGAGTANEIHAGDAPVRIQVSEETITIVDNCGGITIDRAKEHVFRIGRVDSTVESALGVYGIGLKRAIFKIGKNITIESKTSSDGWRMELDVDKWSATDSWMLPFEEGERATSAAQEGTTITIRNLTPEVKMRTRDPALERRLFDQLGTTYSLFLSRFLAVTLNNKKVPAKPLPIGSSAEINPVIKKLNFESVEVELVAGLAARVKGEWNADRAGWYVLCNGRVVVAADKTELTGWGVHGPQFASKYRGFVGIAFFFAHDPASLPWTTTKRGLNLESEAYQTTRVEMTAAARPALSFLNNMYPSEAAEHITERRLADDLRLVDVRSLLAKPPQGFTPKFSKSEKKKVINVQYKAPSNDVDKIRKKLNKPNMGAGAVGLHTFEYFLRMEVPE